ncbi:MAG: energy transducer TonB [Pyrinomonadaceae bacterium]|nr:energy transducer TonB [Pyrinomonadaceae bacterium]
MSKALEGDKTMRRTIICISLALSTFAIGFLTVDEFQNLSLALPVALLVLILLKKILSLNFTLHHLKVAILTLLIWTPFAALTLSLAIPKAHSCVVEPTEEEMLAVKEQESARLIVSVRPQSEGPADPPFYRTGIDDDTINTIWGGILDNKPIAKPRPYYPPAAKADRIVGIVAVNVVIDGGTGLVIAARVLSGHPLLRQAAIEAAYQARFSPPKICGARPVNVSGILTYKFGF